LWYGRGSSKSYIRLKSPDFFRPKPDLLPAKGVVLPSQAGSTTASHQPWLEVDDDWWWTCASCTTHARASGAVRRKVLNPEYTGMLTKVLFIDIDTFVIRNLDEVFCAPRRAGRWLLLWFKFSF
jgi:hypothetical protein